MTKKGIFIAGGGNLGSITVGRLLARNKKNTELCDYEIGGGNSTGALAILLVLLKKFSLLKEAYTSVSTGDITEVSAFKSDGRPNVLRIIWRTLKSIIVKSCVSLGDSHNLRKLLDKFVTLEDFLKLREEEKEAFVTAYNLNEEKLYEFSTKDNSHEDFKDWCWASANYPLFFSVLNKEVNGTMQQWADGGISDVFKIDYLFEAGCTEVDLFVHQPNVEKIKKPIQNVLHYVIRVITAFRKEISRNDIENSIKLAKYHRSLLRVHWIPEEDIHGLGSNSIVFNKRKMDHAVKIGEAIAFDENYIVEYDFRESTSG